MRDCKVFGSLLWSKDLSSGCGHGERTPFGFAPLPSTSSLAFGPLIAEAGHSGAFVRISPVIRLAQERLDRRFLVPTSAEPYTGKGANLQLSPTIVQPLTPLCNPSA